MHKKIYHIPLRLYERGDLPAAYRICNRLLRKRSLSRMDRASLYYIKADILMDQKNYLMAIAAFKAGRNYKERPDAILSLGHLSYYLGRYRSAMGYYRKLISDRERAHIALSSMGRILMRQGRIADSVHCYRLALKYRNDYAPALKGLRQVSSLA